MVENKIENKDMESKKFVVKVFEIYPCWGMGQLSGAVICDDDYDAHKIATEIRGENVGTEVEEMSGDFENALWKEWAEDVHKLASYDHYGVSGLNIITAEEYRRKGFEFVEPNYDEMYYTTDGEFVGWYDAWKDAFVDAKGRVIYRFNDDRDLVDSDGKVVFKFDDDGNLIRID
jgi:hypothetical protein